MQITVIGAGAMGSLFGALLHRAGNQVTLVDTRSEYISALQRRGITVEEPDKSRFTARVPATTDVSGALAADLYLLCDTGPPPLRRAHPRERAHPFHSERHRQRRRDRPRARAPGADRARRDDA
jgi:UDP-glucose 6-dehydrogenase